MIIKSLLFIIVCIFIYVCTYLKYMNQETIQLMSYVKTSKYRQKVLKILLEKDFMTPKDIAENVDLRLNHISMTLGELKNKKLVNCVNEDMKRGRFYKITELGKKIINWFGDKNE